MLKQLFLTLAILISVTGFISCSKDEPNNGGKDPIENPTDDPKDDPTDDPTDDPKDDPADDGTVTVNADGTTSNGMQFRRINETNFMLNYVEYHINAGHLEVVGYDEIEVSASLKWKVTIVPAVTIDGTKYFTRSIRNGCFGYSDIVEIFLPNTITDIVSGAFAGAKSLRSIVIPGSVKVIKGSTFKGCTALEEVKLNEGLETIEGGAFRDCISLRSIEIPNAVMLKDGCFSGVKLEELILPQFFMLDSGGLSTPVFSSDTLNNIYINHNGFFCPCIPGDINNLFSNDIIRRATLHVPYHSLDSYKKSEYWGKFKHIEEYNPESLFQ